VIAFGPAATLTHEQEEDRPGAFPRHRGISLTKTGTSAEHPRISPRLDMNKRVHVPVRADENVVAESATRRADAESRPRRRREMNMFVDRPPPSDHVCPARGSSQRA
jgi:hypothetical protein